MASFTIKENLSNASFAAGGNFDTILNNYLSSLTYTKYNNQTLIYCNHPESMSNSYYGDASRTQYYVNKQQVKTSDCMVYASYDLLNCSNGYFAIRVYNPNNSSVTLTKENEGFSNSGNWGLAVNAWTQFFYGTNGGSISVPKKTSKWFVTKSISPQNGNRFVEYLMKFTTTGTIDVAVYFCKDLTAVPQEDAVCVPRTSANQESYAGKANNFYISTAKTLYAADALVSFYNSYFFGVDMYKKSGNPTEHNPIQLVQGGTASENASYPLNNLGNYGLQYAMSFKLRNNHTKRVKFKGYIISNSKSHCCGIQSGGIAKGKFLEPNAGGYNRWQFYESADYINAGDYTDIDFQYMHLSKGSAPGIIQFEVIEEPIKKSL